MGQLVEILREIEEGPMVDDGRDGKTLKKKRLEARSQRIFGPSTPHIRGDTIRGIKLQKVVKKMKGNAMYDSGGENCVLNRRSTQKMSFRIRQRQKLATKGGRETICQGEPMNKPPENKDTIPQGLKV